MQNALWKDDPIIASKVALDVKTDADIRIASKTKELHCPDPDCDNPLLCYRHGKIRIPHFAHVGKNVDCDYARFDSQNDEMQKTVCWHIYEILAAQGYNVKIEVKLFGRQYTHLTVAQGETVLAIQIAPYNISAKKALKWICDCEQHGVTPLWLIIGAEELPDGVYENSNYGYLFKRHKQYSPVCKNAFIISNNGSKITRYKIDPNMSKYVYNGRPIDRMNCDYVYFESAILEDLTFEDGELSIKGYNRRYNEWLAKRMDTFKQELSRKEERMCEERCRAEQPRRVAEQRRIEEFDLGCNEKIRLVRERIYSHFSSLGFYVERDKKTLPYHYSHLLLNLDDQKLAIEVIDEDIPKFTIDELINWYRQHQIPVQWIIAGNSDFIEDEQPCFTRKQLLTETDWLIISDDGDDVLQQINDPNSYMIHGEEVKSQNYPEWFVKKARFDELIWENNRLTIPHFYENYQVWLEKKQRKFKEKCDAEEKKAREQRHPEYSHLRRSEERFSYQQTQENAPTAHNGLCESRRAEDDRRWRKNHKGITEEQKQKVHELLSRHIDEDNT